MAFRVKYPLSRLQTLQHQQEICFFLLFFFMISGKKQKKRHHKCPLVAITGITILIPYLNSSTPEQNGRHFADDVVKCIFMNEKFFILNRLSLKFVPKGLINNIAALVSDNGLASIRVPGSWAATAVVDGWQLAHWSLWDVVEILKVKTDHTERYIGHLLRNCYRVSKRMLQSKPILVHVKACCHQATSHNLDQCCPRSLLPFGVTRPQWDQYPYGCVVLCLVVLYRSSVWAPIQYKDVSYQYRKSHCGDKTVVRSSYLHNGICYTAKMSSLESPDLYLPICCSNASLTWGQSYDHQSLQSRHNEPDGVSNHQRLNCLLDRLFRCRSQKTSKLHVTGPCEGNPLVTGGFPSQKAIDMENGRFPNRTLY